MANEKIYTNKAPEPIGPYSQGVKIDSGFVFTSGQIAIDPTNGQVVSGGIKEQTKRVLENIRSILQSAGSDVTKAIKTTVYLKNVEEFAAMNEVYAEYFGESRPARSTVEVSRLPKDALVMIDVVAVV